MAQQPSTSGTIGCHHCRSETIKFAQGWIITPVGDFSFATICDCVNQCGQCGGTGMVEGTSPAGYSTVASCAVCSTVRRNVRLYNLAGIPAKYYNVVEAGSFNPQDNDSQRRALGYVQEYVKSYPNKRGFVLMGGAGLGKTHLAIHVISSLTLGKGRSCVFKDFFYLLSDLKNAYSRGESENEVIQPLIDAEVLVIDELGKGRSTDWELSILDQIISKRYNSTKSTLLTTNYITAELANENMRATLEDRVGDRIVSRLYEMCEFIHLEGADHRRNRGRR